MFKQFFRQIMTEIACCHLGLTKGLPENMIVGIGYRTHTINYNRCSPGLATTEKVGRFEMIAGVV
jgi:hypothetical protein